MTAPAGRQERRVVEIPGPITSRAGRVLALLGHHVAQTGPPVVGGPWDVGKSTGPDALDAAADADVILVPDPDGPVFSNTVLSELAERGVHVVALTPWGARGPRADWPASDHVVAAAGGWSGQIGEPDGPPTTPPAEQAWTLTGVVGALAALLVAADGSGGRRVDIAAVDVVAATLEVGALAWIHERRVVGRPGRRHPLVPHELVRAVDGWMATGLGGNDSMWTRLRDWLASCGHGELTDPAYDDAAARMTARADIAAAVARFCATRPRQELTDEAQARRVPWAAVLRPDEVATSPQLRARRFFAPTPAIPGSQPVPRLPWLSTPGPAPRDASEGSHRSSGGAPLDGIVVIDLTWVLAGPFATRVLADHGAEVVKIESVHRPDPTRYSPAMHLGDGARRPGEPGHGETSGYFANHNRNKRSVALNLRHGDGQSVLRRLIASADVVIDNFSAGTLASWGLDPEALWELRPDLVVVEMSGMGQRGPWSSYVSYADAVSALSGLTALTTDRDGEAVGVTFGLADLVAGYHGALATVSALHDRAVTGHGAYVDVAQLEAMAFNLASNLASTFDAPTPPDPSGSGSCPPAMRDVFILCAGGDWCAASFPPGSAAETAARERGEQVDAHRLASELRRRGVPAARVADGQELVETDADVRAVPLYAAADHPFVAAGVVESDPIIIDGRRPVTRSAAPLLGHDTADVLSRLGGFSPDEIERLRRSGVLE